MASVAEPEALLTAEQYARRPDPGYPEELVRGRIVPMPMPKPRHGYLCNKAGRIFGNFVDEHHLVLRQLSNDGYDRLIPGSLVARCSSIGI